MKMKVFSIYDEKAEAYLQPFFMSTSGQAIRSFTDACKDANSSFSKHPADYSLYCIGEFDDCSAELVSEVPVRFVIRGSEVLNES